MHDFSGIQQLHVPQAATLASEDDELHHTAYCYGENVGMAFQLVDDMLDYKSTAQDTGKPTSVDLHLGLATAPVLYAAQQVIKTNNYMGYLHDVPLGGLI